ncbi:MAG TPA: V-type ATP synthase subunit E family protein [Acetomicrobium sp.]|jgi:V/A-type H+-transporting ATPase subunit E|uniref:V-type ATP synthase subunit E n=1 Tax=Acetomicrobium sp. TaxID=1872099 RepID=UPI002B2615D9|nr:V-type ATP synthase subunit E family protein [Acetomicrobium sp.]HPT65056.1 V-type ATP synthase subunit E family protein [Acetomicrobium sp.]HXK99522.1 V-type ATP synthase subunit E family protein [Acetomicrobium sp.]
MALADVKLKIEEDAKRQAEEILKKAKADADDIISKAEEEAQKIQNEWMQRAKEERENVFKRREIVANLDLRKLELAMKRSLIEGVLSEAREKLCQLDSKTYVAFVAKLLKTAVKESESVEGVLYVGEDEKVITNEWIASFNEENGTKLVLAHERLPHKGGFVLNLGDIDINCSFDMLITNIQDDLELTIAKELFAN